VLAARWGCTWVSPDWPYGTAFTHARAVHINSLHCATLHSGVVTSR